MDTCQVQVDRLDHVGILSPLHQNQNINEKKNPQILQ